MAKLEEALQPSGKNMNGTAKSVTYAGRVNRMHTFTNSILLRIHYSRNDKLFCIIGRLFDYKSGKIGGNPSTVWGNMNGTAKSITYAGRVNRMQL